MSIQRPDSTRKERNEFNDTLDEFQGACRLYRREISIKRRVHLEDRIVLAESLTSRLSFHMSRNLQRSVLFLPLLFLFLFIQRRFAKRALIHFLLRLETNEEERFLSVSCVPSGEISLFVSENKIKLKKKK